jgi:hypothetical protein
MCVAFPNTSEGSRRTYVLTYTCGMDGDIPVAFDISTGWEIELGQSSGGIYIDEMGI